jgi:hypothetical protein
MMRSELATRLQAFLPLEAVLQEAEDLKPYGAMAVCIPANAFDVALPRTEEVGRSCALPRTESPW